MIPAEFIDGLLAKTNIAEIISDYTPLTPNGAQLRGECPFCHNKKPLFTVSKEKRLFKCFSCNKGGNAIRFIMDIKKLPYPKAIWLLAEKANMEMPVENNQSATS